MSSCYFKNYIGLRLKDEQMQDIPHPTMELTTHITLKTVQSFGLIGTLIVGPINAALREETRNVQSVKEKMTSAGRRGAIAGLIAGPVLTFLTMRKEENVRIWDRSYRLRCNRCQVRVDRASILFAACGVGAAAATAAGAALTADEAWFGGLVGMSGGILLAAVYNAVLS